MLFNLGVHNAMFVLHCQLIELLSNENFDLSESDFSRAIKPLDVEKTFKVEFLTNKVKGPQFFTMVQG